jgi:hypothetical protein
VAAISQTITFENPPREFSKKLNDPDDPFAPALDEIIVEMIVDHRDDLVLTPAGMYLKHYEFAKPGLVDDKGKRYVLINDERWDLKWRNSDANAVSADDTTVFPIKLGPGPWKFELIWAKAKLDAPNDPGRAGGNCRGGEGVDVVELYDGANGAAYWRFRLTREK